MENGNVKPGDIRRTVCHGDVAFPLQEGSAHLLIRQQHGSVHCNMCYDCLATLNSCEGNGIFAFIIALLWKPGALGVQSVKVVMSLY